MDSGTIEIFRHTIVYCCGSIITLDLFLLFDPALSPNGLVLRSALTSTTMRSVSTTKKPLCPATLLFTA